MKNIILLAIFVWAANSFAGPMVVKESLDQADAYKVEKPGQEQNAQRSVAGDKIKKKKKFGPEAQKEMIPTDDLDSEVRYWKYSEE